MNKTEEIKTRIEPSVKKRLQAAAKEEKRTLSNLLQAIVSEWLEKRK